MKYLIVLSLLIAYPAFAQQAPAKPAPAKKEVKKGGKSEISPEIEFAPKALELAGRPGATAQGLILVKNKSKSDQTVEFKADDLYLDAFGNSTSKGSKNPINMTNLDLKNNVIVSETNFTIKAGEEKKITMSVKIPADAKEEIYFKYTFRPTLASRQKAKGDKKHKQGGLGFYANLFVVAKVRLVGLEKYSLEIPTTNVVYDKNAKQVRVNTMIKNTSTVHIKGISGLGVLLKDNKKIARMNYGIVDVSRTFVPKSSKRFQGTVGVTLTKGSYDLVETFTDTEGKVVKVKTTKFEVK